MKPFDWPLLLGLIALLLTGCKNQNSTASDTAADTIAVTQVQFDADSAYATVVAQCDFGPRVPNTQAHAQCADYIMARFKSLGLAVSEQRADLTAWDGKVLHARNLIASYRPELADRILVCTHWESRPWADADPDSTKHRQPVMAANDGASGVAVMLELARLLPQLNPAFGVDFICFDAEDYGTPQWFEGEDPGDTWALGAQYFANNLPEGYAPRYGILLDMVGGVGAKFYREGMSMQYAPAIVKKVWNAARQVGYGSYFPKDDGGMITDDHIPVNQTANIPCIDVIPYYPDCAQSSFGPTWHTIADNMDNIDKNTLKAVGQTMVQVLFTEK